MKVLVTGVAGFIGSNLAEGLLQRDHSVVGVDNMSQGDVRNMAAFAGDARFTFHRLDIRNREALSRVAAGTDVIVHLAAYKIPRYTDALETLRVNAHGSESVAEVAREHGLRLIAASTSDVYGKNPEVPFSEESNLVMGSPTVRRWAYAVSKMFEEQLLFAYHDRYGLDVVVLRPFGGYGPNQNLTWWGGPQSVFINAALDGAELEIHGDGTQSRSLTYVSDHVDGIISCVETPSLEERVFNIGSTEEVGIADLARLIWRLVRGDEPAPLRYVPYSAFGRYEDVRRRLPDIDRARRLLGFEPKVRLEDGLKTTIAWQVQRRRDLGIPTLSPTA